jgi:uncharacterized membrane protein YfcA
LTSIDGDVIKPYISAYLLIMGLIILWKAYRYQARPHNGVHTARVSVLGVVGGCFDAIGGGGWGPIVTTTLVARGKDTRLTIGSVNFSEFFVTFSQSIVFVLTLNLIEYWKIILGLLLGGVVAAPMAAVLAKTLPTRILLVIVGLLIVGLSIRTIVMAIG